MPHLTDHERCAFSRALYRPTNPHHLPSTILRRPHHGPPNPILCHLHHPLHPTILSSLTTSILRETTIMVHRLRAALRDAPQRVKGKYIDSTRALLGVYEGVLRLREARRPGACEGCFVREFSQSMESLRGFLEGGMVWKRDRSRVREWVGEWVGLGGWGGLVREDVARRAHHVRKVVKAGRRRRRRVELEGREVVELEGEMRFPRFGGESGSGSGSDEFDPFVDPSDEDEDEEYGVRSARGEVYPLFYREYSPPGDGLPSRPQRQAAPQHTGSRGYSQEGGCVYSRGWPGVPRIVVTQPLEG